MKDKHYLKITNVFKNLIIIVFVSEKFKNLLHVSLTLICRPRYSLNIISGVVLKSETKQCIEMM